MSVLFVLAPAKAEAAGSIFEFFYDNACGSCTEDEKIFDIFKEEFSKEERGQLDYEIRTYNVFQKSNRELFEKRIQESGRDRADCAPPVLIADGNWLCGYDQIKSTLRTTLLGNDVSEKIMKEDITAESGTAETIVEESATTEGTTTESSATEGTTTESIITESSATEGTATESIIAESSAIEDTTTESIIAESSATEDIAAEENKSSFTEDFLQEIHAYNFDSQDKVALLFTTYSCDDCNRVKSFLKEKDITGSVNVLEFNIAEGGYVEVLQEMFDLYEIPEEKRMVPIVFYGGSALAGADDICGMLKDSIAEDDLSYQALQKQLSSLSEGGREGEASSFLALFGAGLLAGFNPCSISMLLMLFSILLTAQASVLKNGALYLGGKYLTYFGLGIGIYFAASMIDQEVLDTAGRIINIVIAVLFGGAAFMNLLDFWNVRKEQYGKVRMQLPSALRKFNHKLIKNAGNTSGKILPFLVLGLGIAVSLGEFFCTGQIYMASILYMLRAGTGNTWHVLASFLVYVTAMCIPAAVFIFIILKTKNTNRISDFMLTHMDKIKLANAVLFLGFALYFVFIL